MASGLESFNASPLGALIHSGLQARGYEADLSIGDLVFGGAFTTFGGVGHQCVAVWRAATGTYDTPSLWNFSSTVSKVTVVGSTLYVASGSQVYRANKPGYTSIASLGSAIRDMCEWNGDLIIAGNFGLRRWDGASLTTIADDTRWTSEGYAMQYASVRAVDVGGSDVLAVWMHDNDFGGTTIVNCVPAYYDGSSWTYDNTWLGATDAYTQALVATSAGLVAKRFQEIGGLLWFVSRDRINQGSSTHFQGTNRHAQIQAYDPVANQVYGWPVASDPFSSDIDVFTIGTACAKVGSVGGKLLLAGQVTAYDPKGGVGSSACGRTEELTPATLGSGSGISNIGGFRSVTATIYEPSGTLLFSGIEDTTGLVTGQVTQVGGGFIDSGASLRLATFDGATWASWPEQPNNGIYSIYEAPGLTI